MKGIVKAKRRTARNELIKNVTNGSNNNNDYQRIVTFFESFPDHLSLQSTGFLSDVLQGNSYNILEDTEQVDGIGGVTWEGSLVLSHFFEIIHRFSTFSPQSKENIQVLELGAGNGLFGILLHRFGYNVTISDRFTDLLSTNLNFLQQLGLTSSLNDQLNDQLNRLSVQENVTTSQSENPLISQFDWREDLPHIFNLFPQPFHIIFGAEITCLRKQQPHLIEVLSALCDRNPNTIIFLTFDDLPSKLNPNSYYEKEFIQAMKAKYFSSAIVFTGKIEWQNMEEMKESNDSSTQIAYLDDITLEYDHDLDWLSIPNNTFLPRNVYLATKRRKSSRLEDVEEVKAREVKGNGRNYHHILAFFRSQAINTCSRCQKQFFRSNPLFNSENICCYHTGYYVCRRHPAETKLSIDGKGDELGYYGNGKEGWRAEFWDCCGNEDINAIGCQKSSHTIY